MRSDAQKHLSTILSIHYFPSPNREVWLYSHHSIHQFGDSKKTARVFWGDTRATIWISIIKKGLAGNLHLSFEIFPLATKLLSPVSFSSILTASAFNRFFKWNIKLLRRMTVSARFVIVVGNCEGVRIAKVPGEVWTEGHDGGACRVPLLRPN